VHGGRLLLDGRKPTVSEKSTTRPLGISSLRVVGSSVAKSLSSTNASAPVRRLSSVLLPAFV
jgi:hypothetical protein